MNIATDRVSGVSHSSSRVVPPEVFTIDADEHEAFPTTRPRVRAGTASRPPIEIRQVRPSDLAALRRIDEVQRLYQPEAQLTPYSPLRAGVATSFPPLRSRRPFFVAAYDGRVAGFAHFQPLAPDQRWELIAVGAAVDGDEAVALWDALLTHGVWTAGTRGVKRLYARVPQGAALIPALHNVGWAPYASETIFAAYDLAPRRANTSVRQQRSTDTWAIHQLYNAAVPRDVQYAEAFTSHRWDVDVRRGFAAGAVQGWVIEEDQHLIGYARTTSREGTVVLELVYEPGRADSVSVLIDAAVRGPFGPKSRRVYCPVRGYQAELATALEAHGFAPVLEQELHIRYTTVTVRAPAPDPVPFHVEVRDALPKRVPSFLHGTPRDESAT